LEVVVILTKIPEGTGEVISILQKFDLLTIEEIDDKIPNYSIATIRYSIRRLLESSIIMSVPDLLDMRSVKYRLAADAQLREALTLLPKEVFLQLEGYLNPE